MSDTGSYELFGNVLTFRIRPSGGAPMLVSTCRSAPGAGAPPNRHAGDDEAFSILSGQYEFEVDGVTRLVGPGDLVTVPNGAVHSFRNPGPGVSEMLVINWPGHVHEAMFSTLGHAVSLGQEPSPPAGPPPAEVVAELKRAGAACGVEFLD